MPCTSETLFLLDGINSNEARLWVSSRATLKSSSRVLILLPSLVSTWPSVFVEREMLTCCIPCPELKDKQGRAEEHADKWDN